MKLSLLFLFVIMLFISSAHAKNTVNEIIKEYDAIGVGIRLSSANKILTYAGDGLTCSILMADKPKNITWTTPVSEDAKCQVVDNWAKAIPALAKIIFPNATSESPDYLKAKKFFLDSLSNEKTGKTLSSKKLKSGKYEIQISTSAESADEGAPTNVKITFSAGI